MSDSSTSSRSASHSVFIVDPDPVWRQNIDRAISGIVNTNEISDWDGAMRALRSTPTNIIVVGPHATISIKSEVGPLLRMHPHLGILLVMDSLDIDGLREALRAGVREVLPASTGPDDIHESVRRLTEVIAPLPAARPAPPRRPDGLPTKGKLVMVCGAKGGTGVTTVAINLAAAFAAQGRSVALCDADPVFGDVTLNLGMKAPASVDAGDLPKNLKVEEVAKQLETHEATGVKVLSAFRANIPLHQLPEDLIMTTISGLQSVAEIVILDIPAPLVNAAEYLVHADELFFVATPDVAALKNLRVARQLMSDAGLPVGKAWLILNRIRNMADFEASSFQQIVGIPVVSALPDSTAVQQSADSAQALLQMSPRDGVSRAIVKLAEDLGGRFDEFASS